MCQGQDFMRDHDLAALDLACLHVYPDQWLPPPSSRLPPGGEGGGVAAEAEVQWLAWAHRWVAAHAQDALRLQKPLLITEVRAWVLRVAAKADRCYRLWEIMLVIGLGNYQQADVCMIAGPFCCRWGHSGPFCGATRCCSRCTIRWPVMRQAGKCRWQVGGYGEATEWQILWCCRTCGKTINIGFWQ
jgi:hypothetical protein